MFSSIFEAELIDLFNGWSKPSKRPLRNGTPQTDRISRWFSGQEMTSSVSAAAFRIAVGTGRYRSRKRIGSSGLARLNEISLVTKGAVSQAYAQVVQAADLGAIECDETTADQRGTYTRLESAAAIAADNLRQSLAGLSAAIDSLKR